MFARPQRIEPGPGQESVWDYPRPPRLEAVPQEIHIVFNGETIARTQQAKRILETSHPPVYYIPLEDIQSDVLIQTPRRTWCEWKGACIYYTVKVGDRQAENAAWAYPDPVPAFSAIAHHVSFYASLMDECYVGDELVQPQKGDFYGGWITANIVGPFKGGKGTWGW